MNNSNSIHKYAQAVKRTHEMNIILNPPHQGEMNKYLTSLEIYTPLGQQNRMAIRSDRCTAMQVQGAPSHHFLLISFRHAYHPYTPSQHTSDQVACLHDEHKSCTLINFLNLQWVSTCTLLLFMSGPRIKNTNQMLRAPVWPVPVAPASAPGQSSALPASNLPGGSPPASA